MSAVIQKALIITLLPSPTKTWGGGVEGKVPVEPRESRPRVRTRLAPSASLTHLVYARAEQGAAGLSVDLGDRGRWVRELARGGCRQASQ